MSEACFHGCREDEQSAKPRNTYEYLRIIQKRNFGVRTRDRLQQHTAESTEVGVDVPSRCWSASTGHVSLNIKLGSRDMLHHVTFTIRAAHNKRNLSK